MYVYDEYDQRIVEDRVKQFRDQTRRYLAGELTGEEFRPLRLQNGLYIQRYAPMLRIAVPYGLLSSRQLRKLAQIARDYDKGYAHISTRQNVQFNWPELEDVPEILAELATVQMHAIQTSGNCIRNTTTDQFAGVARDELVDPRPWCEIIRQWSTFHPEFAHLPRKFKIAVNGAVSDRAAIEVHDIGLEAVKNEAGELGFRVSVGGGLGRTPIVGSFINEFLPWQHLLGYLDAILRVYNRYGRRDNKYKARIKILVKALTPEVFAERVEAEWANLKDGPSTSHRGGSPARRRAFRRSGLQGPRRPRRVPRPARRGAPRLRPLARTQHLRPQEARLRRRDALAEAHRHRAGRRHRQTAGGHRRSRRPLQLRRGAQQP